MKNGFDQFHGTSSYLTNESLEAAVNCAIALERPLLLKGEPGTGKTLLAEAISEALNKPLLRWHVKSTTKAQDGLYIYDTVQRLYDARFGDGDVQDIKNYIRLGPLGESFAASERVVLLIDEVDKADVEFPNDLLNELDRMRFFITETREEIVAQQRPIVLITSNNEKELPDAFLRRCVFHFIDFPDEDLMRRIVEVHHPGLDQKLLSQAMQIFYKLRNIDHFRKKPSTSELVDWLSALTSAGIKKIEWGGNLPFMGTLLKKEQDGQVLDALMQRSRNWRP
ncbi:MAG: ATP-binding protein [Myxococcales bacterium]|nr:ATP-binding protein [Myxococcales bacterium]|tara:strand:- start:3972 stop:4814 length:843 start_codon:yes stop_codon:yes gene_type:complete